MKLRKCPFCGGHAEIRKININSDVLTVGCTTEKCIARLGHIFYGFVEEEKVADAWNKRAGRREHEKDTYTV